MTRSETKSLPAILGALVLLNLPAAALAKDVPFVPTPVPVVEAMLEIAKVGPEDFVIDLGSGDGRIVITAAEKHGARGFGVDLDKELVARSKANAEAAGVSDRVDFHARDLFDTDISEATVLTMYLLPRVNLELRPRLFEQLRPGTRVVSHDFDMGTWRPDRTEKIEVPQGWTKTIYYWVIPAQVDGGWDVAMPAMSEAMRLEISQTFQDIRGTAQADGRRMDIRNGRLDGETVSFTLTEERDGRMVERRFEGRVDGDRIQGRVVSEDSSGGGSGSEEWSATRTSS